MLIKKKKSPEPRLITNLVRVLRHMITHIDIRRSAANARKNENAGDVPKLIPGPSLSLSAAPPSRSDVISIHRLSPANAAPFIHLASSVGSAESSVSGKRGATASTTISPLHSCNAVADTGGIRILSSLSSMHRELFCQTIEANRACRIVAVN